MSLSRSTTDRRPASLTWCDGFPSALRADALGAEWICPLSGRPLALTLRSREGFGVLTPVTDSGRVADRGNLCWPVVDGIPILWTDAAKAVSSVVDAVACDQIGRARSLLFEADRKRHQSGAASHNGADPLFSPAEGQSEGAVRSLAELSRRLPTLSPAARRDRLATAAASFGIDQSVLNTLRTAASRPDGLSALALLTLTTTPSSIVVQLQCGLARLISHLQSHQRIAIGCDSSWTLLWMARHLFGCEQPLVCCDVAGKGLPVRFPSSVPVTILAGGESRGVGGLGPDGDLSGDLQEQLRKSRDSLAKELQLDDQLLVATAEAGDCRMRRTDPIPVTDGSNESAGASIHCEDPDSGSPTDREPARTLWLDRSRLIRTAFEFRPLARLIRSGSPDRLPDGTGQRSPCVKIVQRGTASRPPQWELLLPVDGEPLMLNPAWRSRRDADLQTTADLFEWERIESPSEEILRLAAGDWTAGDSDVIELARRRILIPAAD